MTKLLALLSLLYIAGATSENLKLRYYVDGAYKNIQITSVDNLKVNDQCVKMKACQSLKVAKGKPFPQKPPKSGVPMGNPAANYCWDVGAKNRILKDEKHNQYDFCVFDDGSMIDAWSLYYAHFPNKPIK